MSKRIFLSFAIAATLVAGCDDEEGGDELDDGGLADASSDSGGSSGALVSGTYVASNIIPAGPDNCMIVLEDGFDPVTLINTGTMISLGKLYTPTDPILEWDPPAHAMGSGPYSSPTTATLSVDTHARDPEFNCEYDLMRTTQVTYTGTNMIAVDLTHSESDHTAGCIAAAGFPTNDCTSRYTFTLTLQPESDR